jgi:hypothetical protein
MEKGSKVDQYRLNNIHPKYYEGQTSAGQNIRGHCCEWVTLPGQFEAEADTLRTLYTEARFMKTGRLALLCATCRSLVHRTAQLNQGLTIVDIADNRIFQCDVTVSQTIYQPVAAR